MFSKREITDGTMNSEQFKEIRYRLRLSQEELADLLRVDIRTVRRWERLPRIGKRIPRAVRFAMFFLHEHYPPADKSKARIKKEKVDEEEAKPKPAPLRFPGSS